MKFYPEGIEFTKIRENKHVVTIMFSDDRDEFYLQPDQRWIPHEVAGANPFAPGDVIAFKSNADYFINRYKITVGIVSRARNFIYYRRNKPIPQIELVGLLGIWFHTDWFYKLNQENKNGN